MSSVFYLEYAPLHDEGSALFLSFLPYIILWVSVKHLWATVMTEDIISVLQLPLSFKPFF